MTRRVLFAVVALVVFTIGVAGLVEGQTQENYVTTTNEKVDFSASFTANMGESVGGVLAATGADATDRYGPGAALSLTLDGILGNQNGGFCGAPAYTLGAIMEGEHALSSFCSPSTWSNTECLPPTCWWGNFSESFLYEQWVCYDAATGDNWIEWWPIGCCYMRL